MKVTRTRIIVVGAIVALLAAGAVIGLTTQGSDESAEEGAISSTLSLENDGELPAPAGDAAAPAAPLAEGAPASAGADGSEASLAPALELQGLLDRKIVTSASIDLEVEEVGRNFQDIVRIAGASGGFVASSSFSNVEDDQIADLTVRVPADRYQDVLGQIRKLGDVKVEGSDASDVTEEYTDLEARLRTLEATESRYLQLLGEADEIGEILQVQDRLDGARGQIEQVQGRINLLDNLTDLATITIHLRPIGGAGFDGGGGPKPLEAAAAAWEHSLDAVRGVAAGVLVVGVFSWWLLPPLVGLALGARWWLSRRERPPGTQTAL